ncbi:hypothetical protein QBC42DRAFT_325978, partial [Cladorrhinum samala]
KRRRRPAVSCILCRQRKIRCNREKPCNNCLRSKNAECVYRDAHKGPGSNGRSSDTTAPPSELSLNASSERGTVTSDSASTIGHNRLLRHDIPTTAPGAGPSSAISAIALTPAPNVETTTVGIAGTFHLHTENCQTGKPQAVTRSVSHKARLFGQSHWINGISLLRDMFDVLEPQMLDETSKLYNGLKRCKQLAKTIKQHRAPPWPCLPTSELPPKDVADELVECYLRTIEPIYRILHIPTFKNEYEALWSSTSAPDTSFVIQVKLVLAIGATTYDSTFSLRAQAVRWVYEGQTWLSAPEFKHRLGIQSIQSTILLLFARDATGIGEDLLWTSVGSLVRTAMYMGLHRDSAGLPPTMTLLAKETRRRLWNTILELAVQSSMACGGAPLIGLDDFDTEAPGNFDDDQLTNEGTATPAENPDRFTQATVSIALRKTFPQRLAIASFLNDIYSGGTYQETLRLDTELRAAYKTLTRTLHANNKPSAPRAGSAAEQTKNSSTPSDFQLRSLDLLMRRYFLSLHFPFFGASLTETSFTFSRKVAVEAALRLWRAAYPVPRIISATQAPSRDKYDDNGDDGSDKDLVVRLITNGSGMFRTVGVQAFIIITSELKAMIKEEDSLAGQSAVALRPDLLAVLEDAKSWTWDCISAGQTNIKGYLFVKMACAQVEGLMKGLPGDEVANMVISTAEKAEERCMRFFEEAVEGLKGMGTADVMGNEMLGGSMTTVTPEFVMGDWDYMVSFSHFLFSPPFSHC